ncbi:hypothetical protein ES703_36937 [subsurface metagenome]
MLQNYKIYKVVFPVVTMNQKRGNYFFGNFQKGLKSRSFNIYDYFTKL